MQTATTKTNRKAARAAAKAAKAQAEAQNSAVVESQEAPQISGQEGAVPSLAEVVAQVEAQPAAPSPSPEAKEVGKVVLHFGKDEKGLPKEVKPNRPQTRILLFLAKNEGKTFSRKAISGKQAADVDYPYCTSHLGSERDDIRAKNDVKIYPSLKSLGLVRSVASQGGTEYAITELGKRFVEAISAPATVVAPSAEESKS